jgi:hypothetical protein
MTNPLDKVIIVLDAASVSALIAPFTDTRFGVAVLFLRRNRRYSDIVKQIATAKKAAIPQVSVRSPAMSRQYGALRPPGLRMAKRHTLIQHNPAAYAIPAVKASKIS